MEIRGPIAHYFQILLLISGYLHVFPTLVSSIGINYGQIADNLPSPEHVVPLVKSIGATKVKLYDADSRVLRAFADTGVEFIVGLGNEYLAKMQDLDKAKSWVKSNVQAYLPATKITSITVGNEVLTFNDSTLTNNLLPAMQSLHSALVTLGLDKQVTVTTAHSLAILETSYPPSAGAVRKDLIPYVTEILDFHLKTGSPFLVNAYPFFAYKIDAVYSALASLGYKKLPVHISETGWPSRGDEDEAGATPENARKYNGNLIKVICQKKGTPMRPNGGDLNIYVFALFNENLKPGPASERNYGLFNPDGAPAYSLGITGTNTSSVGVPSTSIFKSPQSAPPAPTSSSTGYLSITSGVGRSHSNFYTSLIACLALIVKLLFLHRIHPVGNPIENIGWMR